MTATSTAEEILSIPETVDRSAIDRAVSADRVVAAESNALDLMEKGEDPTHSPNAIDEEGLGSVAPTEPAS